MIAGRENLAGEKMDAAMQTEEVVDFRIAILRLCHPCCAPQIILHGCAPVSFGGGSRGLDDCRTDHGSVDRKCRANLEETGRECIDLLKRQVMLRNLAGKVVQ